MLAVSTEIFTETEREVLYETLNVSSHFALNGEKQRGE